MKPGQRLHGHIGKPLFDVQAPPPPRRTADGGTTIRARPPPQVPHGTEAAAAMQASPPPVALKMLPALSHHWPHHHQLHTHTPKQPYNPPRHQTRNAKPPGRKCRLPLARPAQSGRDWNSLYRRQVIQLREQWLCMLRQLVQTTPVIR